MAQLSPFLHTLTHYTKLYPAEATVVARVRALVQRHADAFYRTCRPGHITGSAWIVSADKQRCLLTHHAKLGRWLQLGGHADGERAVHRVALREAQEESGLVDFSFVQIEGQLLPFDIDIHPIPASRVEAAHDHYDLRYLLIAGPDQPLRISPESKDLAWFSWAEVEQLSDEAGLRRMIGKAARYL
jgi:8-oxo-dGTP pyrophosphatase MutT (NUDIX family)